MKKSVLKSFLFFSILILISACKKPEEGKDPKPDGGGDDTPVETIVLECDYFLGNDGVVLSKVHPDLEVDYIIDCNAIVNGELNIDKGVTIAFEKDASLTFIANSKFRIEGSSSQPVVFTGTKKEEGHWSGIVIDGSNAGNLLRNVRVEYAGGKAVYSGVQGAVAVIGEDGHLIMENCTIANNKHEGLSLTASREVVLNYNTITNNEYPVRASFNSNLVFSNTSNDFTGNEHDFIYLNYETTFEGGGILTKLPIPYVLKSQSEDGAVNVDNGTLTVEPGVELIMEGTNAHLKVKKNGALKMIGTAAEPIIIKGFATDTAGSWDRIDIQSANTVNEIAHTQIIGAGRKTGVYPNAAVWLNTGKYLDIHDVVFKNCTEFGVAFNYNGAPHFVLKYENLALDNTPKLFSEWSGVEIPDPENP